jgi:hypothetical protein
VVQPKSESNTYRDYIDVTENVGWFNIFCGSLVSGWGEREDRDDMTVKVVLRLVFFYGSLGGGSR